jgi:hypothetical protein
MLKAVIGEALSASVLALQEFLSFVAYFGILKTLRNNLVKKQLVQFKFFLKQVTFAWRIISTAIRVVWWNLPVFAFGWRLS